LLAPAGTPRPITSRLYTETVKVLTQGDTRDKLVAQGLDVFGNTPEQFTAVLREETARWAKVVKAANMKLD
jgi:tripartite-type tricarboxylate transporter receptor subunit TctC